MKNISLLKELQAFCKPKSFSSLLHIFLKECFTLRLQAYFCKGFHGEQTSDDLVIILLQIPFLESNLQPQNNQTMELTRATATSNNKW